jgi:Flp pilus assembly pilin Flp
MYTLFSSGSLSAAGADSGANTSESGQASVEYALVLLGAALVATLLIGWATKTDLLGGLFDHVLNLIKGKAQ